jgi:hypothetical protein
MCLNDKETDIPTERQKDKQTERQEDREGRKLVAYSYFCKGERPK